MIACFMHGDYTFEAQEKNSADRSRKATRKYLGKGYVKN